ncbi:hypothetical protein [Endozoicomonas sp. ALC066]|uniref:hypothetical protein n=1 Tax=Endozoicomonas sp. ALC066 TaxID=3403078 RepID=UPI003BB5F693
MFPTFNLLPSAVARHDDFKEHSAIRFLKENSSSVEHLVQLGIESSLYDTGSMMRVLSDGSLSDGVKALWMVESSNNLLGQLAKSIRSECTLNHYHPISLAVENNYSDVSGLYLTSDDVTQLHLKTNFIPEILRPVIFPLIDKLCAFGHVIPEWRVLEHCNYGYELKLTLQEWIDEGLPAFQKKVEIGEHEDSDIEWYLGENDYYDLYCLEKLDVDITNVLDLNYVQSLIDSCDAIISLNPDSDSLMAYLAEVQSRLESILSSGLVNKKSPFVVWTFSVLNRLKQVSVTDRDIGDVFSWQCTENLVPINYSFLLDFGIGIFPVLDSEYQRHMEVGESYGSVIDSDNPEKTLEVLKLHQLSQGFIEKLYDISEKVNK